LARLTLCFVRSRRGRVGSGLRFASACFKRVGSRLVFVASFLLRFCFAFASAVLPASDAGGDASHAPCLGSGLTDSSLFGANVVGRGVVVQVVVDLESALGGLP